MRYLIFALTFSFSGIIHCQKFSINEELKLANHLLNTNNNNEAIHHLKKLEDRFASNSNFADTINFLLGFAHYQKRKPVESNQYFLKVSNQSDSYNQARFTSIYNSVYIQQYEEAKEILEDLDVKNDLCAEYKYLQKGGLALLEKDFDSYQKYSEKFTYSFFPIEKEQNEMDQYYKDLINFKPKSMAVAGLLSTIIPGTGKMYTGKLGEGISSFLIVSILGAITAENYIKSGLSNYKTITFGSLFGIFYIGNIYGSMISVKVYRDEFYKSYERKILVNLHIPLRNIFY